MAMRDILDRQAGTIEYVLHTHGVRAQVDGGKLSPRLAHFHILLPPGVSPSRLSPFIPDLSDALGVVACRLAQAADGVYLEVPRPDPVPVRLLPIVQRVADVVPPITATLGLDNDGMPLLLRLNSPEVDPVVITGNEGSGKSSLLRSMALSLALHNSPDTLRLLLIDCTGDGRAFRGLENLPHLACPVARGPVDGLVSLRWALRALARRSHLATSRELTFDDEEEEFGEDEEIFEYTPLQDAEPDLVIMIDGADRFCYSGNRRADAEVTEALNKLLSSGSGQGIHMVVSSERPGEMVGVSTSWGARISGRVENPEAARLATGMKGSGAQELLGAGDFLVTISAELIRFQAAGISHSELEKSVELIRSCAAAYPQTGAEEAPQPQPRPGRDKDRNRDRDAEPPTPIRRSWSGE